MILLWRTCMNTIYNLNNVIGMLYSGYLKLQAEGAILSQNKAFSVHQNTFSELKDGTNTHTTHALLLPQYNSNLDNTCVT